MKLEVKNITKSFGEKQVLRNISFSVESGMALGLLGRNGAGKTTTIRIIMGVFRPDSGEILLDGRPIERGKLSFGYLPEERGLYPKKRISDQLCYVGELKGLSRGEAAKQSKLLVERMGLSEYYNKKLDTLSKGNQQKIQLAASIMGDPEIVILDEPFSGLDPVNAQLLKDVVRELIAKNKLVIFSSHQMGYVEEFCQHIAMINGGEIVLQGGLSQIKREYVTGQLYVQADAPTSCQTIADIAAKALPGGIISVVEKGEGCVLTLGDMGEKDILLSALVEGGVSLRRFEVVEPTLEEIFVAKAGGQV